MQFEQKELCYFIDAIKLDCSVQNSINNSDINVYIVDKLYDVINQNKFMFINSTSIANNCIKTIYMANDLNDSLADLKLADNHMLVGKVFAGSYCLEFIFNKQETWQFVLQIINKKHGNLYCK